MTRRFAIKKEIRSLGIDLCDPKHVIGAVVRGGLYLDGIVAFTPKANRWSASIANGIVRTRFYPELKLTMTHDPEKRLDNDKVERMTSLPVLQVRSSSLRRVPDGFRLFELARKELLVRATLEPRIVEEVLKRTWTTGSLPEPLRIAHLIAKSRFLGRNRMFWANK